MRQVSLTEAKAHWSELVAHAESGESIQITRRGKPVARLSGLAQPRKPIDVAAMRALVASMSESTDENVVRAMRDDARY